MAVVINDFEVVMEPPAQAQTADSAQAAQPQGASTPKDIENIVRRQWERHERVWAH